MSANEHGTIVNPSEGLSGSQLVTDSTIARKSNILTRPEHRIYKPFSYPWAYEYWHMQQEIHWLPKEVPMAADVVDWNSKLTPAEIHLITQIFRFFVQGDIEVSDAYREIYLPVIMPTEMQMMMTAFANAETIHIAAYSHLLDTIGMPEVEYRAFLDYLEMKAKYDFLKGFNANNPRELVKSLAAFAAFTEGLQLFASFAILLNFPRHNKLNGMGQIIAWSVRDETLHCEATIRVFHTLLEEMPELWDAEMEADIIRIGHEVVVHEDAFIDLAFAMGDIEGLKADDVKQYIRFIADRRFLQLRMSPQFGVKDNPLQWMEEMLGGMEHANFFEQRSSAYSKAGTVGSWDEAFDIIDRASGQNKMFADDNSAEDIVDDDIRE